MITITTSNRSAKFAALFMCLACCASLPAFGQQTTITIDTPTSGGTYSGTLNFGGWAVDTSTTVSSVMVLMDGVNQGQFATYGGNRPDVCAVYVRYPGCPNVGWNYSINTAQLPNGWHSFMLQVATLDDRVSYQGVSFLASNTNASMVDVDTPQNGISYSGTVVLGGWVLDQAAAFSQVNLFIDGALWAPASINGNRPDVCAVYPGYPGCPNVGWSYALDTTQLSDGTHQFAVIAVTTDGRSSTVGGFQFQTTNYGLGPTIVDIDAPSQGAIYSGTATTGGWSLDGSASMSQVNVFVDGLPYGVAGINGNRPDVCAVYQNYPGCPNVGWSFNLDTTKLSNGPHEFNITTVTTDGRVTASGDIQFQVSNTAAVGPTLVDVDAPSNGNTYSGSAVSASGWAIDATATISQVVLQVDGNTVGTATYGGSRPDVCNVYPGYPGCPNVGWNFTLNTTNLANGAHQLIAVATTSDGRSTSSGPAQFVVSNVALPTPLANIDLPSNGSTYSGTINPSGWAIDANYPITQVTLAVDGTQIGSATLGGYRPDVCAVYVGYAGCPNVGWTLALDTTTLSPGTHQMIATATTSDGRTTTSGQVQFQTAIAFDPTHPSKEYIRLGGQMIAIENAPQ